MITKQSLTYQTSTRRGFTLIELLAATVLSTMLMVALAGVLNQVARQRQLLSQQAPVELWRSALQRQLRWDLDHARKIGGDDNHLRLVGYAGRDFRTHAATQRPTEIIYEIVEHAERTWLVRTEIQLDAERLSAARSDLVAAEVTRIEVWRTDAPDNVRRIAAGLQATPSSLRIRCVVNDSDHSDFDQQFVFP